MDAPILDRVLARSFVQAVFQTVRASRLIVLAYHDISQPDMFLRQLRFVQTRLRPLSLDDILSANEGRRLPNRSVLVTFDDGDRSVLETGLPILSRLGIPAVAFVVPGVLDSDLPHWWVEVEGLVRNGAAVPGLQLQTSEEMVRWMKSVPDAQRAEALAELRKVSSHSVRTRQLSRADLVRLEAGGVEVGNHTLSHRYLSRCSSETVRSEIEEAHRILADALGHSPRAFAYPDRDCDSRVLPLLRQLGYSAAFRFDHRLNRVPLGDPFAISRVRVSSTTSMDRFRMIVSGLHPAMHNLRSRVNGKGT